MTTNMIRRRKAARTVAAFAAAGASLLLAAPSASAAVSGLDVTPGVTPFSLAGTDYGTTCSIELAANASLPGGFTIFYISKWDDTTSTFVRYATVQTTRDATPGPRSTLWEPTGAGKYEINLAGTSETETIEVANGINFGGLVCVVLPVFP